MLLREKGLGEMLRTCVYRRRRIDHQYIPRTENFRETDGMVQSSLQPLVDLAAPSCIGFQRDIGYLVQLGEAGGESSPDHRLYQLNVLLVVIVSSRNVAVPVAFFAPEMIPCFEHRRGILAGLAVVHENKTCIGVK